MIILCNIIAHTNTQNIHNYFFMKGFQESCLCSHPQNVGYVPGVLPYMSNKGMVFQLLWSQIVYQFYPILTIIVINRVWFLHSSLNNDVDEDM